MEIPPLAQKADLVAEPLYFKIRIPTYKLATSRTGGASMLDQRIVTPLLKRRYFLMKGEERKET